jgi:hypothetical protein
LLRSCRRQQVAFNKLLATSCLKVAQKLPRATSCFQQVACNKLLESCYEQLLGSISQRQVA